MLKVLRPLFNIYIQVPKTYILLRSYAQVQDKTLDLLTSVLEIYTVLPSSCLLHFMVYIAAHPLYTSTFKCGVWKLQMYLVVNGQLSKESYWFGKPM